MTTDAQLRFQITQLINQDFTTNFTGAIQKRLMDRYGITPSMDSSATRVLWEVNKQEDGRIIVSGTVQSPLNAAISQEGEIIENPGSIGVKISVDTSTWIAKVEENYRIDMLGTPILEPLDASVDFYALTSPSQDMAEKHTYPTPQTLDIRSGTYEGHNLVHHHVTYQGLDQVMNLEASKPMDQTMVIDGSEVNYSHQQLKDAPRWPARLPYDPPDGPIRNSIRLETRYLI